MQKLNDEAFINKWWSSLSSPLSIEFGGNGFPKPILERMVFGKMLFLPGRNTCFPLLKAFLGNLMIFITIAFFAMLKQTILPFPIYQKMTTRKNWTYEKIHHCVNYQVDKWANFSPKAGQLIAIVGAPNSHFLISLLTAFRFGLKICYLPTNSPFLGRGEILKLLSEIKPQFISSEDPFFSVEGTPAVTINEKGLDEENHAPQSYAYTAAEEVQLALSVEQQEAFALVPVDAQTTYLDAMRDALFTFNLFQHPYWTYLILSH